MNRSRVSFSLSVLVFSRCALVVAMIGSGTASAQDGPSVRFSGFGTIGVAHSSEKDADFTSVGDQPTGAGHTRSWDFDPDSKLAAQVDVVASEQLSATAQLMTRQRYDDSYRPELMMAFGKWQFAPEYALRVGRMPLPVFLISDSRTVGFSQTQIRPPVDMYNAFSVYHYDGADLTWTTNFGGIALKSRSTQVRRRRGCRATRPSSSLRSQERT